MFNNEKSVLDYKVSPYYLSGGLLILYILIVSIYYAIGALGWIDSDHKVFWTFSGSFTLMYSLFCSVMLLPHEEYGKYYMQSIIGFVVISVISGLIARLYSGVGMDEAGSYRWLYVLFTICFLIFLGIARFIKRLVKITQREEKKNR